MRTVRFLARYAILCALAIGLTGCFQSAGVAIQPTLAELTASPIPTIAPPTSAITDTPFITPISTEGFLTPTENGTALASPTLDQAILAATISAQPIFTTVAPDALTSTALAPTPTNALPNTPTAFATEGPCTHTVAPGEHLYAIARQYNITYEALLAANPQFASHPDQVKPGDVLKIPTAACAAQSNVPAAPTAIPPTSDGAVLSTPTPVSGGTVYLVASGDNLGVIAHKFGVTVKQIMDANGLTSDRLSIGQRLIIPTKS